jgi:hypothetical protein
MATNLPQNTFNIPKGGYVAFDATSLRQLIINRLNDQQIFTDQNFIGSNLAAVIDIIAYSYNTLIYYLNRTSSESMFTEAQLYENINRIVKLIDYSPIGFQTSTLSFTCSAANNIPQGIYTIPRYSYVVTNNIPFSFNQDITFTKTNNTTESLDNLASQQLLYQGIYQEYPIYTATGDNNEVVIVNPGNDFVDHFNIDVYVKPQATGVWEEYSSTPNLFLENGSAKKYEIRLNESKYYEIKFGDNINGNKLQPGDQVAVYYLVSLGADGQVGANALTNNSTLTIYNSQQYSSVISNVNVNNYNFITSVLASYLLFTNPLNSTPISTPETADDIRNIAPKVFRSQHRLVTINDFNTFIASNFQNLLASVNCINNWDYVSKYLKYFYDIGINNPELTERALFNQITYADACNFNNIYVIAVPRSSTLTYDYLLPAQKTLVKSSLTNSKLATIEVVFADPVYKAAFIGLPKSNLTIDPFFDDSYCNLQIIKTLGSQRDNQAIIKDIVEIFNNFFSRDNLMLGSSLDVTSLTQQILAVNGVSTFNTIRTDDGSRIKGLSFIVYNPVYPSNDVRSTSSNLELEDFQYLYYKNLANLSSKIVIQETSTSIDTIGY